MVDVKSDIHPTPTGLIAAGRGPGFWAALVGAHVSLLPISDCRQPCRVDRASPIHHARVMVDV